jgi:hypothetical protein
LEKDKEDHIKELRDLIKTIFDAKLKDRRANQEEGRMSVT